MNALPYGPNTADIRRFLVQLAGLGASDRARVVRAHAAAATTPAWHRAETRLGTVIERSGREAARDALTGPLLQLVRRQDASPLPEAASDQDAMDSLAPVAEPALAALLALVVKDLLTSDDTALLLSPFAAAELTLDV